MGRKALSRKPEPKRGISWPRWTGFRGMTLRSWLELLVVPLALVVIGFLFTMQQDARQQRVESQRAEAERGLAQQQAQDEALQAYLDQMSTLLIERDLRSSTEDKATEDSKEARILARARTLTVLARLDPSRKAQVMQFLMESDLVNRKHESVPIIWLAGANLRKARLKVADLDGAMLAGANLSEADLNDADLSGASLAGADLGKVEGITNEELEQQAASLTASTMPNGQKYEDWLKDKARESDGQNSGTS